MYPIPLDHSANMLKNAKFSGALKLAWLASISARNLAMKKKSELTEDDLKELEEAMQKLTDKRCKEIDDLTAKKEAELMAV